MAVAAITIADALGNVNTVGDRFAVGVKDGESDGNSVVLTRPAALVDANSMVAWCTLASWRRTATRPCVHTPTQSLLAQHTRPCLQMRIHALHPARPCPRTLQHCRTTRQFVCCIFTAFKFTPIASSNEYVPICAARTQFVLISCNNIEAQVASTAQQIIGCMARKCGMTPAKVFDVLERVERARGRGRRIH